jgi:hypothetical protein
MPIVLSYNDVEALGSLAYNAGALPAKADRGQQTAALMAQIDAERNRTALGLQQISAQERQAQADRQAHQTIANQQQQYRYDALAADERQNAAQLDAAMAEAGLRSEQGMMDFALRGQRDKALHQMTMERIEREAQLGKHTGKQPATIGPGGLPTHDFAEQEVQENGHLIPFRAGESVSAENAGRTRQRAMDTATDLSSLPTPQLEAYIKGKPNDQWAPYVRAVIQARRAVSGGQIGNNSAMPEGGRVPGGGRSGAATPAGPTGYAGGPGRGFGDPRLTGLSDQQLLMIANDPDLLAKLLTGQ